LHAQGSLSAVAVAELGSESLAVWPPTEATPIDVALGYDRLAAQRIEYGDAFRAVQAVWATDLDVYAEVRLSTETRQDVDGYLIHPALLDAAVHSLAVGVVDTNNDETALPYAWSELRLGDARGLDTLRVHGRRTGEDVWSILLFDTHDRFVASIGSLMTRPMDTETLSSSSGSQLDRLYQLDWIETEVPSGADTGKVWIVDDADTRSAIERSGTPCSSLQDGDAIAGSKDGSTFVIRTIHPGSGTLHESSYQLACTVLELLKQWVAIDQSEYSRLVVLTKNAVSVHSVSDDIDPASSAAWGMVRSAQSEYGERFVLVDTDGEEKSLRSLAAAVSSGESQIAIRAGKCYIPRVARAESPAVELPDFGGTALITGGTGTLGAAVARHLVRHHHIPSVILVSRSGLAASGAPELRHELLDAGAQFVEIIDCDISDREAMSNALGKAPSEFPVGLIVHAAGVLADSAIASMTSDDIATVFAPKVEAAHTLYELANDLDEPSVVFFSSVAGILGGAGQGNYAAANAFLDALATRGRKNGMAVVSLAWGLWAQGSGMTGHLSDNDLSRIKRLGIEPLAQDEGLRLFDLALRSENAALVPIKLSTSRPTDLHGVPSVLRSQFATKHRIARGRDIQPPQDMPPHGLAGASAKERKDALVTTVLEAVSTVLGYRLSEVKLDKTTRFSELGLDSLTAIEFRNRLKSETGLTLPSTLIFDYPTPVDVAEFIATALGISDDVTAEVFAQLSGLIQSVNENEIAGSDLKNLISTLRGFIGDLEGEVDGDDDLEIVSDDDLFDLVDRELGLGS
ncbi:type I polyketide synthase, partial [Nocardia fluminea]